MMSESFQNLSLKPALHTDPGVEKNKKTHHALLYMYINNEFLRCVACNTAWNEKYNTYQTVSQILEHIYRWFVSGTSSAAATMPPHSVFVYLLREVECYNGTTILPWTGCVQQASEGINLFPKITEDIYLNFL